MRGFQEARCSAGSGIRGQSPFADEVESLCSGETGRSVVCGQDDEVVKAPMPQVVEQERGS